MSVADERMPQLVASVRHALRLAADPTRAAAQQAYMKSAMPFLGVRVPEARSTALRAAKGIQDAKLLREAARRLWDDAGFREERYAAMALLVMAPASDNLTVVALIEHMVRSGQWWDYTDDLAHRLAEMHDRAPVEAAALARRWSRDENLWIRRIAILSQLGRCDRVDAALLDDVIAPNAGDTDFFVRKAIGWALRDYARVDAEWVREYVAEHELSPLSGREALKHLS